MNTPAARIRAAGDARTFVSADGDETPLPSPSDLKAEAMAWLSARARRGDRDAAEAAGVLAACELEYEVTGGESPGVVAVTDDDRAWLLADDDDSVTWYVVSALHEACPASAGFRALARG